MGNCHSNNVHHVRVSEEPSSNRLAKQEPKVAGALDGSDRSGTQSSTRHESSVSSFDPTSPANTVSTINTLTPESIGSPPLTSRRVLYEMPHSSATQPLAAQRPRRKGRALQARLDKARSLQQALNSGSVLEGTTVGTVQEDSEWEEDDAVGSRPQFSLATDSSVTTKESVDNFEATMSQGTIWQKVTIEDASAVAFSRHTASLERRMPELLLASGTRNGRVLIHTLHTRGRKSDDTQKQMAHPIEFIRRGRIRSLDFDKSGQFLAVGGDDGMAAVYQLFYNDDEKEVGDGRLLSVGLVVEIPRVDRIYSVKFRPDSKYLAIGGFDGCVAIFDTLNWELVEEVVRDDLVYCIAWSPDSQYLALGGSDKTCAIVNCRTSWRVAHEVRRPAAIQSLEWHPNGRSLAIGASNVAIVERDSWTVRHEAEISSIDHNDGYESNASSRSPRKAVRRVRTKVQAMCWSPNGSYLLVSGADSSACSLLETKSYTVIHEIQRDSPVNGVAWGEQSVLGGIPARYICVATDECVVILKAGLETRSTASSAGDDMSANLSTASSYFSARGSEWEWKENNFQDVDDGNLRTFNHNTGRVQEEPTNVQALCFSRGSRSRPSAYFCVATDDGFVTVRSTNEWKVVSKTEFVNPIRCCAFSNGSRFLALGGEDAKVYILATVPTWSIAAEVTLSAPITCVAFSKNNERLVVGSLDGTLSFLDARTDFRVVNEVVDNESPVLCLDWSSRNLAVGRHDGRVSVYDTVQIFRQVFNTPYELSVENPVRAVAFGVSSRFLVVGGDNGIMNVFSAKVGWELCQQTEEVAGISAIRWSPTGRYVAVSGEDGFFKVIDTVFWTEVEEAGDRRALPLSEGKQMCNLAFSQDGNMVACGTTVVDTQNWSPLLELSPSGSDDLDDFSLTSQEENDQSIQRDSSAEF